MRPLLVIKSATFAQHEGKFKHSGQYFLSQGRWHTLHADKAAPKGAPVAAHPHAGGQHMPVTLTDDEIAGLKYHPDKAAANAEMAAHNEKHLPNLLAHAAKGDATAILGSKFGTNSHAKKQVAVANFLLGKMGSQHQVAVGQQAGEHAAVQSAPEPQAEEPQVAPEPTPEPAPTPEPEPVASTLTMPEFQPGKTTASNVDYYKKIAQMILDHAKAGDAAALEAMAKPEFKSWQGKTPNSKMLLALHAQALEQVKGGAKPAAPEPQAAEPAPARLGKPAPEAPAAAAPAPASPAIDWSKYKLPDTNTNAASVNKKLAAIQSAFEAGNVAQLQAMKWGVNTYNIKLAKVAQAAIAHLQSGEAAPAAAAPEPVAAPAAPAAAPAEPTKSPKDQLVADLQAAGFNAYNHPSKGVVLANDGTSTYPKTYANQTQALNAAAKLVGAGFDSEVLGMHPYMVKVHGKLPAEAVAAAQEPAAAPAAQPAKQVTIKLGASDYTQTDPGLWISAAGKMHPTANSVIGAVLELMSGGQLNLLPTVSKLQKEVILEMATENGVPADKALKAVYGNDPKEGDTKVINDVTYQLINGRWHKVSSEEAAATEPAKAEEPAAPQHKGLTPAQAMALGKGLKTSTGMKALLKQMAVAANVDGLQEFIDTHPKLPASKHLAQEMIDAITGGQGLGAVPGAPKPKAKPKAPAKPAPAPAAPAIPSMDDWVQTGGQGGSNPGGKFKDPQGNEFYCKFPENEGIAKSEVLAAKLYGLAGMAAQQANLVTKGGKVGIASKWMSVSKAGTPADLAAADGALQGFAVDAWLGNWDVVGMGYDNLMVGADGKAVRVDAGGSLEYRAQGAKKPFGNTVDEIDTLRDKKVNPQSAAVFGKMTEADITASVAKVLAISDQQIRATVAEHGPGDLAARKALAETLIARKNDLQAKYPKAAASKPKQVFDPAALPVNPSSLPEPHKFADWNGAGQGLSSKSQVNAANQSAETEALALAQTGNLTALRAFKFHVLDKNTGQPTGEVKPISQHPSKHVQQFVSDLITALEEVANPPEPLKIFQGTDIGTLEALDAAFPPKKFGTTTKNVASNEKLGFWVALGAVNDAAKLAPKKISDYTSSAIAAAKVKYQAASKLAKHFIGSVQASGSYNDLFRDGKEHDHQGNKLSDVAKAALEHATEMPEGTSLYRWQKMTPEMVKAIMAAPDGMVFQATGPMCTSYHPTATAGFGKHRISVRYSKGAKAVESFASGGFAGEKEVTTLPNARFVILSKKMVPDTEHGYGGNEPRLELEVLMLPPDLGIN